MPLRAPQMALPHPLEHAYVALTRARGCLRSTEHAPLTLPLSITAALSAACLGCLPEISFFSCLTTSGTHCAAEHGTPLPLCLSSLLLTSAARTYTWRRAAVHAYLWHLPLPLPYSALRRRLAHSARHSRFATFSACTLILAASHKKVKNISHTLCGQAGTRRNRAVVGGTVLWRCAPSALATTCCLPRLRAPATTATKFHAEPAACAHCLQPHAWLYGAWPRRHSATRKNTHAHTSPATLLTLRGLGHCRRAAAHWRASILPRTAPGLHYLASRRIATSAYHLATSPPAASACYTLPAHLFLTALPRIPLSYLCSGTLLCLTHLLDA